MTLLSISTANYSDIIAAITAVLSAILVFQQIISSGLMPEEIDTLISQSNLSTINKQKIVVTYNKARTRSRLAFILMLFVFLLAGTLFFINISPADSGPKKIPGLKAMLMTEHDQLFHKATLANLEFARVLPDATSLNEETSFSDMIKSAKQSFWIMTTAFKQLQTDEKNILDFAIKGGHVKILLLDTISLNRNGINHNIIFNCDPNKVRADLNTIKGNYEKSLQLISEMQKKFNKKGGTGIIEVKIYNMPLNYQIWVKDGNSSDGLAQVNSFASHATAFRAIFRVTPKSSTRLFQKITEEFTDCWNDSKNKVIQ